MAKYGSGTVYLRGNPWWIHGPGAKSQSAETRDKKQAQATLKIKIAEAIIGKKGGAERATVADILALVVKNYKDKEKRTTAIIEGQIRKSLVPALGKIQVADLSTRDIDKYKRSRQAEDGHNGNKTRNATINRELSVVRRGLTLGRRESPPKFTTKTTTVRKGDRELNAL